MRSLFTKRVAGLPLWQHAGLVVGLFVAIFCSTWLAIKRSDAYVVAREYALNNSVVIDTVGERPVVRLALGRLNVRYSDSFSSMRFPIRVEGPRGAGRIRFLAVRQGGDGSWVIKEAVLDGPTGEIVLSESRRR